MVLMRAAPKVPPVCWVVLTSALATPASAGFTPIRAVLLMDTKERPMPRLTITSAGRTTLM